MQKRRNYSASFKAKVAISAIKGDMTLPELASKYDVHPNLISKWKQEAVKNIQGVFEGKVKSHPNQQNEETSKLYKKIGQLQVEVDFFKGVVQSLKVEQRLDVIKKRKQLSIARQCKLLDVSRSAHYYKPKDENEFNMILIEKIFKRYLRQPYLGSRGMTSRLQRDGFSVNRKRIKRLMQKLGLKAVFSRKPKYQKHKPHKIYPYLLKELNITRPNQVWCTDITYIPMKKGFIYLVAVMDWYSRRILSWRISNTLDVDFCKEALLEAISKHGVPEIFNTDQGVQFTSKEFTNVLKAYEIAISMDGKGRALDNIMIERFWRTLKYEEVYLNSYDTIKDAVFNIGNYIWDYNNKRPHSSFNNQTPKEVYKNIFMLN